jgi:hypothetical protein
MESEIKFTKPIHNVVFRPREFIYAFRRESYRPTTAVEPPAKRQRGNEPGGEPASPTPGRHRSTMVYIHNPYYSTKVHQFSLAYLFGV